jgi:homoserine dehydrogenase
MLQISPAVRDTPVFENPPEPRAGNSGRAVLKFGSSVLKDHHDLPRVAGEIYRQSLRFRQLIVIVSAFEGETDKLLARHRTVAGTTDCRGVADLVSLGEELTAAQLRIACSRIGLEATLLRPEQWGIEAAGSSTEATPTTLPRLPAGLENLRVIIIPGFVGLDEAGSRVLLGRGGSDFSAIFIGGELAADCVRLYKDVDGVYDHDPALGTDDLHRFDEIDWDRCLEIARPLLQPDAIEYARGRRLNLEVGSIGSSAPTLVTDHSRRSEALPQHRALKVGIAGFGVVGQALYRRLAQERDFHVSAILVRDRNKKRDIYPPFPLTDCMQSFCDAEFDVVIDVTCGEEAGFPISSGQLQNGRTLISANKTVIEPWYEELATLGRREGGNLGISACVGGGTPILELIDDCVQTGQVRKVTAVLNGTVNFVLDQLASGHSFEIALARARRAGFAELDPSQDLSGADAETKLRLIARRAFGCSSLDILIRREQLTQHRIRKIRSSGQRWIQLATLERAHKCVIGSIGFVRADSISRLPNLPGEQNFLRLHLADGSELETSGRGAGGPATAEAIMTDLYACLHRHRAGTARPRPASVTTP